MSIRKSDIPHILLNNITGKIGGIVLRKRYGKTIISAVPQNYRKSLSVKSVNNRKRFAVVSNISTALTKVPEFKEVWKIIANNKMSSQNAAASFISKQISKDGNHEIQTIFPSELPNFKSNLQSKSKSGFCLEIDYGMYNFSNGENNFIKNNIYGKKKRTVPDNMFNNETYVKVLSLFMLSGSEEFPDMYIVIPSDFYLIEKPEYKSEYKTGIKQGQLITTTFSENDKEIIIRYAHIDIRYIIATYNRFKELVNISKTNAINDF